MEEFAGDKKKGKSILHKPERRFVGWAVPKVPWFLETYHLTSLTFLWSVGIILCGWLAQSSLWWIHGISVLVFAQWLTDSLDGAVGRDRGTGLVKWGYFADHLLDMMFAGSVTIGYMLLVEGQHLLLSLVLLATCMIMAVTFLNMAATNEFQISYMGIGPTEIRIAYIAMNTAVAIYGMAIFDYGVPIVLALNIIVLAKLSVTVSKNLWASDMDKLEEDKETLSPVVLSVVQPIFDEPYDWQSEEQKDVLPPPPQHRRNA